MINFEGTCDKCDTKVRFSVDRTDWRGLPDSATPITTANAAFAINREFSIFPTGAELHFSSVDRAILMTWCGDEQGIYHRFSEGNILVS